MFELPGLGRWRRPVAAPAGGDGPPGETPPPAPTWRTSRCQVGQRIDWDVAFVLPCGRVWTASGGQALSHHAADLGLADAQARIEQIYRATRPRGGPTGC